MSDSVDWKGLWEEFGFDTPDANGATYASQTQLITALESNAGYSVQSPVTSIEMAVETGGLHRLTAKDEDGIEITRGYVLGEGE